MAAGRGGSGRLAIPLRWGARRAAFGLFLAAAAILIAVSRVEGPVVERVRAGAADVVGPVVEVLGRPVGSIEFALAEIGNMADLYEENARLREENARLKRWQQAAVRLEQENAAFRAMLRFRPDPRTAFVTARAIADTGGPFVETRLLNAGQAEGVDKGLAVVTGDGLVGRIVEVGRRTARLLLLTDLNSRVPVQVMGGRYHAIMVGANDGLPRLQFAGASHTGVAAKAVSGDRIVTSGTGGLFPAGLLIGEVVGSGDTGLRVRLAADLDRLDLVRVVRYRQPGGPNDPEAADEGGLP